MNILQLKEAIQIKYPQTYRLFEITYLKQKLASVYLLKISKDSDTKGICVFVAGLIIAKNRAIFFDKDDPNIRRLPDNYPDLILLDGSKDFLSKDAIKNAIFELTKTALEEHSKRVLVIVNLDNSSIAAQNTLLKFLEEHPKNIFVVMSTINLSKVLSTIISRCRRVDVKPLSIKQKVSYLEKTFGTNMENSSLFARIFPQLECDDKSRKVFLEKQKLVTNAFQEYVRTKQNPYFLFNSLFSDRENCFLLMRIIKELVLDVWRTQTKQLLSFANQKALILELVQANYDFAKALEGSLFFEQNLNASCNYNLTVQQYISALKGFRI